MREGISSKQKEFIRHLEKETLDDLRANGNMERFVEEITVPFRLMQEMENPSWPSPEFYLLWENSYFTAFEDQYFRLTGIRLVPKRKGVEGRQYYNWHLYKNTPIAECFKKFAGGLLAEVFTSDKINCQLLLNCTDDYVLKKDIEQPIDEMKVKLVERGERSVESLKLSPRQLQEYYRRIYSAYHAGANACYQREKMNQEGREVICKQLH